MATSGSKDFSLTCIELIRAARRLVPGKFRGDTKKETDSNREALNMILKHWQGEGYGLHMYREISIFLSDGGYEYDLGPAGHFAYTKTKTELASAAASGATSITVDSATGISDGDILGIELDSGTLQWTTVDGSPSGTTVTPADALTGAAAADNHVYTYTNLADRPLRLNNVRLVDPDGDETPMTEMAVEEYDELTDKDSTGVPSQWAYDKQLTNGVLKIWPAADDVQYYIKARAQVEVDDLDASTDDLEFPKQYYRAMKYTLARDIFFEYEPEANKVTAESWLAIKSQLNKDADRFKYEIAGLDSEEASVVFDYIP